MSRSRGGTAAGRPASTAAPRIGPLPAPTPGLARAARLGAWALAVAGLVWAAAAPGFRDPEGSLAPSVCLPVAVSLALLALGWAATGRLWRAAAWFALALVGQAVALQLVDAGPLLHYQHYRSPDQLLTETPPLLLAYLAAQATLVLAGLRARWPAVQRWLRHAFRPWQLAGVGLVFFLSSATVSPQLSRYLAELLFATFVQLVSLGNVVLLVAAVPDEALAAFRRTFERVIGQPGPADGAAPSRLDRFAAGAAVWVTALAALLNVLVYQRHPHIADEVAYLYQARFLANGALTMPAPPVPAAFEVYLMQFTGDAWYPVPPPGWPVVLAIGVLFGAPWLVDPVLAGLNVLLAYVLLQDLYDRRLARLGVLLLCASPWYLFMAMNFMTHTLTLTCALLAAVAIERARRARPAAWGGLAGLAVGLTSLIRPLDGAIAGGLVGLWALGLGGRRLDLRGLAAFASAAALVSAAVLPYNAVLTGKATLHPIMAYTDEHFGRNSNAYGFGPDRGMGWPIDPFPGHGPIDALINANLNTFQLNVELFGWGSGSLLLVALALFASRPRRSDYLMAAVVLAVFGAYFFYYFSGGPDFGARYWYLMIVPLVVFTVKGVDVLRDRLARLSKTPQAEARAALALLALCALALPSFLLWRSVDKYYHYLGMRPDVLALDRAYNFGRSLVLIRGEAQPDYASAMTYNPLDLHADAPIYAHDLDPEVRARVIAAYADRPVWLVDGPSITGRGYRVVAGPLPSGDQRAAGQRPR